jgi:hypothetical protein
MAPYHSDGFQARDVHRGRDVSHFKQKLAITDSMSPVTDEWVAV